MTPEATAITEGDTTWAGPEMAPHKYATLHKASNEVLADTAVALRAIIADTMIRDVRTKIDKDCFGAATSDAIKGLTATGQHTKTSLATGNTTVKWDNVVDAVADIEATGAAATVVWCSPDMAKALRKERERQFGRLHGEQRRLRPGEHRPGTSAPGLIAPPGAIGDRRRRVAGLLRDPLGCRPEGERRRVLR
ncbi:hypothetical protein GCM10010123_12540 [Pilimelia anulata]|uniref:Phage capsid-like C-terminal domain-containing protein n=1 Tax=Pilimelia anulata TaxID=53371 RepID=A0A8J3B194_9ACTN|nr:hypothetical protein GCM10010123_12540 [Pilimelia anulata]